MWWIALIVIGAIALEARATSKGAATAAGNPVPSPQDLTPVQVRALQMMSLVTGTPMLSPGTGPLDGSQVFQLSASFPGAITMLSVVRATWEMGAGVWLDGAGDQVYLNAPGHVAAPVSGFNASSWNALILPYQPWPQAVALS